jgi:hypothetical protein
VHNPANFAIRRTNLNELSIIEAWRTLRRDSALPVHIQVLKEDLEKSAIYRLFFVGAEYSTVIAKRRSHYHAFAERIVYEQILVNLALPVPHYFGYALEPDGEFGWLFLEDVGDKKYRSHVPEHRAVAAQWLGIMHTSTASIAGRVRLPERGPEYYLALLKSAHDTIQSNINNPAMNAAEITLLQSIISHCEYLVSHWSRYANLDQGMPCALVHGDFIENNVRIRTDNDEIVVLPFDWEKAGWGIPVEDISNVDINAYWSTVREHWPNLSFQNLAWLTHVGKVYRCIVFLDWIAPGLARQSKEQPMNDLKKCDSWLGDLLKPTQW